MRVGNTIIELMKISFGAIFIMGLSLAFSASAVKAETVKFESEIKENLPSPFDVALSSDGHLFVISAGSAITSFDTENNPQLSFKLSAAAAEAVTNPNPPSAFAAIALSPKGQLIVADSVKNRVEVYSFGGELLFDFGEQGNLPGQFKSLNAVDVDLLGFIYATDLENKRIQVFTPSGILQRVIALTGQPVDVTVDQRGNVYALLPRVGKIEKFSHDGKKLPEITCQSSGVDQIAKASRFHVDPWGDIYLVQKSHERIVKIDAAGKVLITFGSEGNARGQFADIGGLTTDDAGRVYVADEGNLRIQIFKMVGPRKSPLAKLTAAASYFVDFDSTIEAKEGLMDIFVQPGKGLFSVSDKSGVVNVWDHPELIVGAEGSAAGQLLKPQAVAVTLDGKIYIADTGNHRVSIFNADGSPLYQFGKNGNKPGQFNAPQGIAVNGKGIIYVADTLNHRIQMFNQDGIYLSELAGPAGDNSSDQCRNVKFPKALAIDSRDQLYVVDAENAVVKIFTDNGSCVGSVGAKGSGSGELNNPVDVAIDQNDNLYVADAAEGRIKVYDSQGSFLLSFGSPGRGWGYFKQITAIAASDGKIYVADYLNPQIQVFKYAPDGLASRPDRLYATQTASPPSVTQYNDVLRYTIARKAAYRDALEDFVESLDFTEDYLRRFVRVESVESLNDGKVKVTISIPKYIPKQIAPVENLSPQSGGS